jgi:glutamate formiminotransferase/formiminotetrahydrofolate cyclodeaminase
LCARTAVMGAFLNVKINSADLEDRQAVEEFITRGREIEEKALALEREILETVNRKM